jgi:hypothetical protein
MPSFRSLDNQSVRWTVLISLVLLSTVLGGCLARAGVPGGATGDGETATATDPATATTSSTRTATVTDTAVQTTSLVHPSFAAERALTAEKDRIRQLNTSLPRVRGLRSGILRGTEWKLLDRNTTGVILRIEIGYSVGLNCTLSTAGPEQAVDGTVTVTRYFVTDSEVSLLSVETAFVDPADYCD